MSVDILTTSIFLLTFNIISNVDSFGNNYVVKKDFFSGPVSREFSVYDRTGKNLKYRIESKFRFRHNNQIVAYPSKQVVGKLKGHLSLLTYSADMSILDVPSNRWIDGNITQNFNLIMNEFNIHWNGSVIILRGQLDLLPKQFYEKGRGELLAEYKLQPASRLWAKKYNLDTYSIKYPETLYFIGLAVEELRSSPPKRG